MKKIIGFIIFLLFYFPYTAFAIENITMQFTKTDNSLLVDLQIIPSEEFKDDFKNGLSKNIVILIELYKKWSIIPDEFISGTQIQKIMISDPIKDEFIIKSIEGEILKEKRFKNYQEALNWALNIETVKIGGIDKLPGGKYYIKVTVQSNIKKLPSVLEHLLFFIPRYEKKITIESKSFTLP